MKKKDIIVKVIEEVTGKPENEAILLAESIQSINQKSDLDFDMEVTPEDAKFLLNELLKQKDEIKLKLIKCGLIPMSVPGSA